MYKCIKLNFIRGGYEPGETVWRPACGDAANDLPAPQVPKSLKPNTKYAIPNTKSQIYCPKYQIHTGNDVNDLAASQYQMYHPNIKCTIPNPKYIVTNEKHAAN